MQDAQLNFVPAGDLSEEMKAIDAQRLREIRELSDEIAATVGGGAMGHYHYALPQ